MNTNPILTTGVSRRGFLAGVSALGVLGALSVTGCATSPGGGGKTTDVETINLYGNALGEDAQKAAWQSVVDGWEKKSGKKIKPVIYPYDQASTQLVLAARGGEFVGVGAGPWQVLVPTGILADLSDLAEGMELPGDIVDSFRIDGKLYVLPTNASGIGLVADRRIAQEVGLSDGLSVEEFAAALERIKQQDSKLIPYAAVTKNPDLKDAVHWMWGWGSEVVTDDLKCTIGDAPSVQAMTWYKELQDAGLTKSNVARADARILFARGQAVMYDDAPLANTFISTNGGSKELSTSLQPMQRPGVGGADSFNRFWGGGLFCSAGKGEQTSKDFIKYFATDVGAATALYEQSAVAPADASVAAKIPGLAEDKFQNDFRTKVADSARLASWDRLATSTQIDEVIGAGVAKIMAGQSEVQQGLNELKAEVQQLLDQDN